MNVRSSGRSRRTVGTDESPVAYPMDYPRHIWAGMKDRRGGIAKKCPGISVGSPGRNIKEIPEICMDYTRDIPRKEGAPGKNTKEMPGDILRIVPDCP